MSDEPRTLTAADLQQIRSEVAAPILELIRTEIRLTRHDLRNELNTFQLETKHHLGEQDRHAAEIKEDVARVEKDVQVAVVRVEANFTKAANELRDELSQVKEDVLELKGFKTKIAAVYGAASAVCIMLWESKAYWWPWHK